MIKPIISFKDFSFQYEAQAEATLKHINLDIYPGEKVLVAGASGSGKSTLGRCLNGLIPQAYPGKFSGSCTVNGKPITESSIFDLSFDVGTVLQDPDSQFVGLTVVEDLAFSLENDCWSQAKMRQATQKWAARLQLKPLLQHAPQEISGGQKQRVAMAGVLIDESKILLFDEPLASLDPASGAASIQLIDQLTTSEELTVILIEHRIEEVLRGKIDRLVVLQDGQIVANGQPEEILRASLLQQLGLREPLYLNALKKSGVSLQSCTEIADVKHITAPQAKEKLEQWMTGTQLKQPVPKKEELLKIKNLTFSYAKDKPVINNLSLTIHKGEMVSLVGRNGTGKSTLSNLITGFLTPQQGTLTFSGKELEALSVKERAEQIGYILQNPNQMISKTTVFDEVASGLRLRGITAEIEDKTNAVLKVCGLYEMRHWPISALSFGQKKRVTIAAVLVLEPQMLILDEPTAGQDLQHYTEIMTFLENLNRKQQLTIILITHDCHLMLEYTERTIVLAGGRVIKDAAPAQILTDEEVIQRAALAKTSLFELADRFRLPSATEFVAKFIQAERKERADEQSISNRI
ncbi:ABC transporter ATP-binding protein [Liquorilactobacillus satsumensis]|uniref:Abc transporter n=1 Tax=Liquorilactobacillus satsumensis DSM 16230 = JCM 12392 TaxID=1423801 RepID=A0A0R1V2X3_9LACO|nr:ABC transporter ATP-binding protein [Liquorilactobacillus satsumensis]KRL99967.1 abc transporter [Liquorilactobacillus satsumensis DSM 16230 = JCM 12392]MCP9311753.1 ABC transporter ATP-binding protein [Liquorilactobacillus satsumensis]MCP9328447.1 ABC transporter ATP-binding protein [Liquorilactobacillus satsumensis]MCP9358886.1 ABC transporter ATP-binding protein [Liquorilactobacillus satsumensis]